MIVHFVRLAIIHPRRIVHLSAVPALLSVASATNVLMESTAQSAPLDMLYLLVRSAQLDTLELTVLPA